MLLFFSQGQYYRFLLLPISIHHHVTILLATFAGDLMKDERFQYITMLLFFCTPKNQAGQRCTNFNTSPCYYSSDSHLKNAVKEWLFQYITMLLFFGYISVTKKRSIRISIHHHVTILLFWRAWSGWNGAISIHHHVTILHCSAAMGNMRELFQYITMLLFFTYLFRSLLRECLFQYITMLLFFVYDGQYWQLRRLISIHHHVTILQIRTKKAGACAAISIHHHVTILLTFSYSHTSSAIFQYITMLLFFGNANLKHVDVIKFQYITMLLFFV